MNPSGYISEINSINEELKRIDKRAKALRAQKLVAQSRLYDYMRNNHLSEFQGIKASSIAPKPKRLTKSKDEKRDDAVSLFRSQNINNPESLYEQFLKTQKYEEFKKSKGGECIYE